MAQPVGANRMRDVYDKINAQWRRLGLLLLEVKFVTVRRSLSADEQRDINSLFGKTGKICGFVEIPWGQVSRLRRRANINNYI